MERIAADRRLAWDACLNVRDLGGLASGTAVLRPGRLVRASVIGTLSDAGREAVRAHGIRTVVDVRGDDEVAEVPSPYREGTVYRRVPVPSLRAMALHDAAHAGTLPAELRRIAAPGGGLAEVIRAIAESRPGIVLHCAAGRDRTGFIVAMLLSSLGVSDDDVVADYVASDDELVDEYERFKAANPDRAAAVDDGVATRGWVMRQVMATVRDTFGGAAAYQQLAGIRPEQLGAIRAMLVE